METVLYEYHFDIFEHLPNLIPLIIGVVFLFYSIASLREPKSRGWDGFIESFFKVAGFIVGPLCLLLFVASVISTVIDHVYLKSLLATDDVYVIEGYVEEFYPMPYEGHDTEHFVIDGVYFEYSEYYIMNGYHKTAYHGGVIYGDEQHLKIKYIVDEYGENIILYIAELPPE